MSKRRKRAEEDAEERPYITRTERTRAATAVNKVAVRMAKLPPEELDQLALPRKSARRDRCLSEVEASRKGSPAAHCLSATATRGSRSHHPAR